MKTQVTTLFFIATFCHANAALTWSHQGSGAVSVPFSSGTIGPATPDGTLLSYGTLADSTTSQTFGYVVTLNRVRDDLTPDRANATNQSFNIDQFGNVTVFTALDNDRVATNTVDLSFSFYVSDPRFSVGNTTDFLGLTPASVSLSITAPFTAPENVTPPGNPIDRLNAIETLDIAVTNPSGTVSRTDPFNQLQTLAANPGFDYQMGWEAAGFGNDLDLDGVLDVNEALFTFDLPSATDYRIVRQQDRGRLSAYSLTTAGVFTANVPEPSSILSLCSAILMGVTFRRR